MQARKMKKNVFRILWMIYCVSSIVLVLYAFNHMLTKDYAEASRHMDLNDGWNIQIGDQTYENAALDQMKFAAVGKGTQICLECTLPARWEVEEGVLRFFVRHTALRMYIDDEEIFAYGFDRAAQHKTVGSGYQFISFPETYAGRQFRIELYTTENNSFSQFDPIQIYAWSNIYRVLITENRIPLFFGIFLVIFGLVGFIITMAVVLFSLKYIRLLCICAFSICIGIWTLCFTKVIMIFSIPLYSVSLLEYIALYLAPLPLVIYVYADIRALSAKWVHVLYWILFAAMAVFDVVSITLHTLDIVHCAALLPYYTALVACLLVFFVLQLVRSRWEGIEVNRVYVSGLAVVALCVGYDMFYYQSGRYFGGAFFKVRGLSCIGMVVFALLLVFRFYYDLTHKLLKEAEQNALIERAYKDELTKIYNRRYCAEYMEKLETEKSAYTIFCFDLNNLKTVNDTKGHAAGDELIVSAAEVIESTFGNYGAVGRMGGDEYIALLRGISDRDAQRLEERFEANIAAKNKEKPQLNLSVAYGYALSEELAPAVTERSVEKLYQLADSRMYENKRRYKENKRMFKENKKEEMK